MRWLSIATLCALIASCFYPWITIESRNITVTGWEGEVLRFGKPGLLHILISSISIVFLLLNKIWSLRTTFFMSAFNIAWGIRNYVSLSSCSGGECPDKQPAIYVVLIAPILAALFLVMVSKKVDDGA